MKILRNIGTCSNERLSIYKWTMRIGRCEAQVDFYALLGVRPDASHAEIRRAYLKRIVRVHPDVSGNDDGEARQVNLAATVLLDADARARYDRMRALLQTAVPATPNEPVRMPEVARRPMWPNDRHAYAIGIAAAAVLSFLIVLLAELSPGRVPVSSPRWRMPKTEVPVTQWTP